MFAIDSSTGSNRSGLLDLNPFTVTSECAPPLLSSTIHYTRIASELRPY